MESRYQDRHGFPHSLMWGFPTLLCGDFQHLLGFSTLCGDFQHYVGISDTDDGAARPNTLHLANILVLFCSRAQPLLEVIHEHYGILGSATHYIAGTAQFSCRTSRFRESCFLR